jgi:hypothetical protein
MEAKTHKPVRTALLLALLCGAGDYASVVTKTPNLLGFRRFDPVPGWQIGNSRCKPGSSSPYTIQKALAAELRQPREFLVSRR